MDNDFTGVILLVTLSVWFGQTSRSGAFIMILSHLPMTLLHELSHLVVSAVTFSRPTGFTLWPKKEGDAWTLGCVTHANIRQFSAMPVAFAPAIVGIPLAWLAYQAHCMLGYVGVFVCLTAAVPSPSDVDVAFSRLIGAVVWVFAGIAAWAKFGNLGELLTLF